VTTPDSIAKRSDGASGGGGASALVSVPTATERRPGDVSRTALVTGCSSGIGKATAKRLVESGYRVYATARQTSQLKDLEALGCRTLALDVRSEESMGKAVEAVERAEGAVGILVNNAGYSQSGAVEAVSMNKVRDQFETNVFGLVRLTQLVLPKMRAQRWGRIVNLSSMGGKLVFPGGGFYHATKYAVEALSDALRFEVRGFGIDVVVIEPGLIKTSFAQTATAGIDVTDPEVRQVYDAFHQAVIAGTRDVYEKGPLAGLSGTSDDVARTIQRAVAAKRPKTRYRVTWSATVLMTQHAILSDRAWDAFLRTNFPSPGKS
jgi:NAD(P)-dependent dehydrogenase (short-subunit alcohol dehydrogenase family)